MNIENIMVCVTQQKTCERLIYFGRILRDKINGDLHIIHVAKEGINFLGNAKESEALEYLFDISKKAGADLTVLRSGNVEDTVVNFVKDNDISHIVLGEPSSEGSENGIIDILKERLPGCNFHIISSDEIDW